MQSQQRDLAFGVAALVDVPMPRLAERARTIEALGFDRLWIPDERLLRNVYVSLATVATSTERIGIGTAVTNPYTRHPAVTAAAIATIDELSGGRTVLGLGAGGGLEPYGIERDAPVAQLRETVEIVRGLTSGRSLSYAGSCFTLTDAALDFPPLRPTPVYVAARGPRILEMAGEVADGVIIGGFADAAGLGYARDRVERGLRRAGRTWDDLASVAWIFVSVSDDRRAARRAVSRMVLAALISSRPILHELGLELPDKMRRRLDRSGWRYEDAGLSGDLLTDEIVDAFSVHGTVDDCARRLTVMRAAGVDEVGFVLLPPEGSTPEEVATRLAREVVPSLPG